MNNILRHKPSHLRLVLPRLCKVCPADIIMPVPCVSERLALSLTAVPLSPVLFLLGIAEIHAEFIIPVCVPVTVSVQDTERTPQLI